jgi:hypothetical protein
MVTHRHQNRSDCQREILNPIGGLFLASIPGLILASAEAQADLKALVIAYLRMANCYFEKSLFANHQ